MLRDMRCLVEMLCFLYSLIHSLAYFFYRISLMTDTESHSNNIVYKHSVETNGKFEVKTVDIDIQ